MENMEDVDFLVPIIIVVLCVIYLIIILFEFDRRDLIIPYLSYLCYFAYLCSYSYPEKNT